MNVKDKNTLWTKIQHFAFDEPGAAVNFSQKLSQTQNWSAAFTKRAIDEYRKFILLCCIAEKGASPSKVVDEVWHLHLTYTTSYWIDFCKNTLEKEIHHHPSKGGTDENHKHEDWYSETLQLYKTVFGIPPPGDIWPKPQQYRRIIDSDELPSSKNIKWAVAIIALPFLLNGILFKKLSPFALTGPEFLVFYFLLGLGIITAYLMLQNKDKVEAITTNYLPNDATVFQMAKFLYGKHRAVQTAIVDLIRRNLLKVNNDNSLFVFNDKYHPDKNEENPLVQALLQQPHCNKTDYETIALNWYREDLFSHPTLDNLYEFSRREKPFLQHGIFYVVLITTGVLRMIQGMANQRPVVFLFVELLVMVIVLNIVMKRSSVKNTVFKKAQLLFSEKIQQQKAHTDYLINNFVVNGPSAMAGFAEGMLLMALFTSYDPLAGREWRTSSSSDWSTDTGSSGDSGGSSCGSGGCGGCGGGGD